MNIKFAGFVLALLLVTQANGFCQTIDDQWKTYPLKDWNCSYQSPYLLVNGEKYPSRRHLMLVSPPENKIFKICYQIVACQYCGVVAQSYFKLSEQAPPAWRKMNSGPKFWKPSSFDKSTASNLPATLNGLYYVTANGEKRTLKELQVASGANWWLVIVDYDSENAESERMANRFFASLNIPHESIWAWMVRKHTFSMFMIGLFLAAFLLVRLLANNQKNGKDTILEVTKDEVFPN